MALFKEKMCVHCGQKTNLLTRVSLENDQYLCGKCTSRIPSGITTELKGHSYDDFLWLDHYMKKISPKLKKMFRETHRFYGIVLDSAHDIIHLEGSLLVCDMYCPLDYISEFTLEFVPDKVKDGIFSTKVTGKVFLRLRADELLWFEDREIASNIKASARTAGWSGNRVVYENPKGMDDFCTHFEMARLHAIEARFRLNQEAEGL